MSRDVSATTDHFTEGFGEEGERSKFVQFVIILDIQLMPQRGVMAVKWDQMVGRCAAAVLQCVHYIQLYTPGLTHSIHYGGCGGAACLDKNKWETSQVWAKCP